ncbi:PREDICTED: vitellogenin-2-like [Wasmannia auropunctata]|uniref:vitellogenin-2-like n=1 Tax=Wasmannia auropunctata TaxID=64793 RepID=UPI0005EDDF0C|nr:PREDICTED: vitellogenin-2-like [Wasmannia auropunctata]
MWFPVTLLLLVGVAVALPGHGSHGWESQNEYQYIVHSRTVTGLDKLKNQYTGLQIKGILTIQAKSPESLVAKLSDPQYARIHTTLPDGPETKISDHMLEYRELPMSGKPFEIKFKHGVMQELMVARDVPTWELNILKGLVSQLQVDTQGENAIKQKNNQNLIDENSSAIFKAMEDSVGGKCEVLYEIIPLPSDALQERPDRLPFPRLHGDVRHYDIKKTKNYNNCQQRQLYHVGLQVPLQEKMNQQDQIVSQVSMTQMIITGDLKRFTIQSIQTKNQVSVKPDVSDPYLGAVHSMIKLTLAKKSKVSNPLSDQHESVNLESTGNLLYAYNDPFSSSENRKLRHSSISRNSAQVQSSESSSSSQSSSEENVMLLDDSLWQSKAPLHMAPNVPLLPYFVGYKGKTIQMSDKVNVVEQAANLISQIAEEVASPSKTNRDTLEKYTIVKNLIRTMNLKQYAELEQRVNAVNGEDQNVWSIFRDLVTHAGTGPALHTIQNWIKSKKIKGIEAARIISQIPKHVRHPTAEYVQAFFEMNLDPVIMQQEYVNVSTPLAFAELIDKSYNGQKYYPIHSFGPMTPEINSVVVSRYIPHMANQMKQGLTENNSEKVQTYIMALGLTGHPNIISVFEPFVEGTKPVTKYQRMVMVNALSTLARHQPKLVGPIYYKLYMNTYENHEMRCLAVHEFIKTNPPLIMWQRLAKFTNVDSSEQVNSVVKSTIESIANLKRSEMQNIANKARSVKYLLTKKDSNMYSKGYYTDIWGYWFLRGLNLRTIVGDDSQIPMWLRLNVNTIFDMFDRGLPVKTGYGTSSAKQLMNKVYEIMQQWQQKGEQSSEESSQTSGFEELLQALNIKPEHLNKLEGHVFLYTMMHGLQFYPFDGSSFEKLSRDVKNHVMKSKKIGSTLINNQEMTISFPIENGLPFVYTFESPVLIKNKVDFNRNRDEMIEQISGNLDALVAKRVQKRFGFLAPFEHQNYMTGVDHSLQLQVPLEFEVTVNHRDLSSSGLKIRPNILSMQNQMDSSNGVKLLHHSTIPFTTRQDVLDLQPVSLDKNTHLILTSEKHKTTLERDPLYIQVESDNKQVERNNAGNNVGQLLYQLMGISKKNSNYKKLDVSINPGRIEKSGLHFNIVYDKMVLGDNNGYNKHPRALESQRLFSIKHTKPNSENRRKEIMETLSQGVKSGDVHVFDVSYKTPLQKHAQVLTVGVMELNNVNKTHMTYVYWNSQSNMEKPEYEACYVQTIESAPRTPLDFEYTLRSNPENTLQGVLRYGKSCMEGTKIVLEGKATQSNELKEAIENSETAKKCWEEIQNGNKVSRACQKATELAEIKDKIRVVVKEITENVQNVINKVIDWLSSIVVIHIKENSKNSGTNTINVKMNLLPYKVPKVLVQTPQQEITYPYIKETPLEEQRLLMKKVKMLENEIEKPSCSLDKNMVVTFDKRVYPVTLGTTKHVLMTAYPIMDPDNRKSPIPEESRVAVVAHDTNDGSRSVNIYLGKREVKLVKLDNGLKAVVDGETLDFESKKHYYYRENGEVVFEIGVLPDHSIVLYSKKYGIYVAYDGKRVAVWAGHRYRNAVRGLCGNFDSNPEDDFLTPENCLLTKPEEFAAMYALIQENSEGSVLENRRRAEQAQCRKRSSMHSHQSNIINDREAGRIMAEGGPVQRWYSPSTIKERYTTMRPIRHRESSGSSGSNQEFSQEDRDNRDSGRHNIVYRTRVLEDNSQQHICFTIEPVPTCREGTTPTERKSKKYDLFCEERNEESVGLKHRVEKGANPDFNRKRASKSKTFQVPVSCSGSTY